MRLTLANIETRTGLGVRQLRYVLDHALVPGLAADLGEHGRGHTRQLYAFQAFATVVAAVLLRNGTPRESVAVTLTALRGTKRSRAAISLWRYWKTGQSILFEAQQDGSWLPVDGKPLATIATLTINTAVIALLLGARR